jgi:hypothetical protein
MCFADVCFRLAWDLYVFHAYQSIVGALRSLGVNVKNVVEFRRSPNALTFDDSGPADDFNVRAVAKIVLRRLCKVDINQLQSRINDCAMNHIVDTTGYGDRCEESDLVQLVRLLLLATQGQVSGLTCMNSGQSWRMFKENVGVTLHKEWLVVMYNDLGTFKDEMGTYVKVRTATPSSVPRDLERLLVHLARQAETHVLDTSLCSMTKDLGTTLQCTVEPIEGQMCRVTVKGHRQDPMTLLMHFTNASVNKWFASSTLPAVTVVEPMTKIDYIFLPMHVDQQYLDILFNC